MQKLDDPIPLRLFEVFYCLMESSMGLSAVSEGLCDKPSVNGIDGGVRDVRQIGHVVLSIADQGHRRLVSLAPVNHTLIDLPAFAASPYLVACPKGAERAFTGLAGGSAQSAGATGRAGLPKRAGGQSGLLTFKSGNPFF